MAFPDSIGHIDMDPMATRQDSFHSQKDLLSPRPISTAFPGDEKKGMKCGFGGWRKNLKKSVKKIRTQPKQTVVELGKSVSHKARTLTGKLAALFRSH